MGDPRYSAEYLAFRVATALKYDPDQPRDENGRWTSTGGGASSGSEAAGPVGRPKDANPIRYHDFRDLGAMAFGADIDALIAPVPTPHTSMGTMGRFLRDGFWDDSRQPIHERILNMFYKDVTQPPDGQRIVYMTGGGFGSGKSTALKDFPETIGFPTKAEEPRCDPDAAKQLLPEMAIRIGRGDVMAASYVHEESSALAKAGVKEALAAGYSPVYDTSADNKYDGDSEHPGLKQKVEAMKSEWGASEVRASYVFSGSVDESWERVKDRQERSGGLRRALTYEQVRSNAASVADCFVRAAADGLYDDLKLFASDGPPKTPPRLIAHIRDGVETVYDADTYQRFKDMRNG